MNQESIQRNIDAFEAKENLTKKERKRLKKLKGRVVEKKQVNVRQYKNIFIILAVLIIVISVFAGIIWFTSSQTKLPPISIEGHIEQIPSAHILDNPMPDVIQRHMLEHSDGEGSPGVIIQYNCKDYDCEKDLVEKLKKIATDYPEYVYLAPGDYDGKIILTSLNRREILDELDEEKIRSFIN